MKNQRHKYEYKVKPHTAADKVVTFVGTGKRVLELGPGPGSITRLLKDNQCRVTALELDPKAIEIVSEFCESIQSCNLNDADWPTKLSGSGKFDVIVAGDVLEHLYDPWAVLGALPDLLADGGSVVISLPHIGHNAAIACLLSGNFEYQPWGLLDKTHIRFFGIANVQKLFESAGFKIVDAGFVTKDPEQTEFSRQWRQLPAETRQALASTNPFGTIYQVVVRAVPRHAEGKALQLASLPIPSAPATAGGRRSRARAFLVSFLSLRTRERISRGLERLRIRL